MKIILLLVMFLAGCTTNQTGPMRSEDKEVPDCYAHYGATPGYCSAMFHRDHK